MLGDRTGRSGRTKNPLKSAGIRVEDMERSGARNGEHLSAVSAHMNGNRARGFIRSGVDLRIPKPLRAIPCSGELASRFVGIGYGYGFGEMKSSDDGVSTILRIHSSTEVSQSSARA